MGHRHVIRREYVMRLTSKVVCSCVLVAMGTTAFASAPSNEPIEGVWRIDEIQTAGPNGSTFKVTQPSLYIFTKKHYSVIRVVGDSPRKRLADDRNATAQELLEVYVNAFIANAGTYELATGKLTTRPTIAKDPGTMVPGVFMRFVYQRAGNTLLLTEDGISWGAAPTN